MIKKVQMDCTTGLTSSAATQFYSVAAKLARLLSLRFSLQPADIYDSRSVNTKN